MMQLTRRQGRWSPFLFSMKPADISPRFPQSGDGVPTSRAISIATGETSAPTGNLSEAAIRKVR
jgi:hypothetical protein